MRPARHLGEVGLAAADTPTHVLCLRIDPKWLAPILERLRQIDDLAVPPDDYLHLTLLAGQKPTWTDLPTKVPSLLTVMGLIVGTYSVRAVVREQFTLGKIVPTNPKTYGITMAYATRASNDDVVRRTIAEREASTIVVAVTAVEHRTSKPGVPFGYDIVGKVEPSR